MGKATLQYLDKRDEQGVMLRYSSHELAFDVSTKALDFIRSKDIYSVLVSKVPKKYIDLYYQKMIYEAFLPIAHQLVIYRYEKQHHGKANVNSIDAKSFPCQPLLREIWPDNNIDFSISYTSKIRNKIQEQLYPLPNSKNILRNIFNPFSSKSNDICSLSSINANIAINYIEGFDLNKRSDLFWFNGYIFINLTLRRT